MTDSGLDEFLALHPEYSVLGTIGRGGMSTVYLAEQLRLERRVAIKLMDGSLADDQRARERFLRETRAVASIDHPGVLPIYDAGEAGPALFTIMRYVDGPDLRKFLRANGPQPLESVARVGGQVADALGAAHGQGLVHRDVKPANILLTASDIQNAHIYLCDFGLVKRLDSGPSLTKMDEIVGTIDYIAPEQIEGGTVDARTDIYSLACVIYEMLAGVPPYQGQSDVSVLWSHLRDVPPPLRLALPEVPGDVEQLLKASMSKSPSDRPASAAEFAEALRSSAAEVKGAGLSATGLPPQREARSSSQTLSRASLLTEPKAQSGDGAAADPTERHGASGGSGSNGGDEVGSGERAGDPVNDDGISHRAKILVGATAAVVFAAILVVVLAIQPWKSSGTNGPMTASDAMTAGGSSTSSRPLTTADKKLLTYIDPELRGTCKSYDNLAAWELAVAGVVCTPPHDATSVTYLQLQGKTADVQHWLEHHFFGQLTGESGNENNPAAGSCQTAATTDFTALQSGPVSREGQSLPAQLLACFHHGGKGSPELVWTTYNPYVLAWATGQYASPLLEYWEFTLGPCNLQNPTQTCNQT